MSTVVEETTPPVECSSRASPIPVGASADRDRARNPDSVAASFIRDRVSQQQQQLQQQQIESKAAELVEATFGKGAGLLTSFQRELKLLSKSLFLVKYATHLSRSWRTILSGKVIYKSCWHCGL